MDSSTNIEAGSDKTSNYSGEEVVKKLEMVGIFSVTIDRLRLKNWIKKTITTNRFFALQ